MCLEGGAGGGGLGLVIIFLYNYSHLICFILFLGKSNDSHSIARISFLWGHILHVFT